MKWNGKILLLYKPNTQSIVHYCWSLFFCVMWKSRNLFSLSCSKWILDSLGCFSSQWCWHFRKRPSKLSQPAIFKFTLCPHEKRHVISSFFQTLPALRSFCIYAAVAILSLYVFQATFFVAWFSLDQRRIDRRLDAFIPCYRHKSDRKPSFQCSTADVMNSFFRRYADFLLKTPVRVSFVRFRSEKQREWGLHRDWVTFEPVWNRSRS